MRTSALSVCLLFMAFAPLYAQQSSSIPTREMDRINWMDFRKVVPS